jgi:site-specific DNA-methyltransferase (adenine-specific)
MIQPYFQDDSVTIYNCDCKQVLRVVDHADIVVTDPPYNVGKDYGTASDELTPEEYADFMRDMIMACECLTKRQVWVAPRYKMDLWWSLLPNAHEVVIPLRAGNAIRQGWSSKFMTLLAVGEPIGHPDDLWEGIRCKGEGYFFREETYGHPGYTPYPIMARAIRAMCPEGGVVLDPFMGTGTCLRAAKDLGRKAIGIEIEEKYCEIAARRMSQSVMAL